MRDRSVSNRVPNMSILRGLLRLLAFVFNSAAGLFLFAVGFVGSLAGEEIHFPLVPGAGENLKWTLMGLGLFALVSTVLALLPARPVRLLMVLWNLLVVVLLIYAVTRSSYRFAGMEHFRYGAMVFAVSLLALWGAWAQMKAAGRLSDGE
jgi:hypothetical protein